MFATLLEYLTYKARIKNGPGSAVLVHYMLQCQRQLVSHPDGNYADVNQLSQC